MGKKLYVGSLSYNTNEEGLRAAFERAGVVASVQIIMDKMTNRSKGFGFVEMGTDEEAQAAIQMWDGQDLDGRTLVVNEARPLEARPPRTGGYSSGGRGGGAGGAGGFGGGNRRQDRW